MMLNMLGIDFPPFLGILTDFILTPFQLNDLKLLKNKNRFPTAPDIECKKLTPPIPPSLPPV